MAEHLWDPTGGLTEPVREGYASLPSTQDRALYLARQGAPVGSSVVAREQVAGRGQRDHRWVSPRGGLYLSILLPAPRKDPAFLSLAAGAAVADALNDRWQVPLAVKWPNDLLLLEPRRAKLAGILTDLVEREPEPVAVLGLGLNVQPPAAPLAGELAGRVAYLSEAVAPVPELPAVEELVVRSLEAAAQELGTESGRGRWLERSRHRLYGRGRPATIDGVDAGHVVGLEDDGALVLERDGRRSSVRSGELRVEGL